MFAADSRKALVSSAAAAAVAGLAAAAEAFPPGAQAAAAELVARLAGINQRKRGRHKVQQVAGGQACETSSKKGPFHSAPIFS